MSEHGFIRFLCIPFHYPDFYSRLVSVERACQHRARYLRICEKTRHKARLNWAWSQDFWWHRDSLYRLRINDNVCTSSLEQKLHSQEIEENLYIFRVVSERLAFDEIGYNGIQYIIIIALILFSYLDSIEIFHFINLKAVVYIYCSWISNKNPNIMDLPLVKKCNISWDC